MSIIIFLIVLAILVLVHELGHFLVAKKSGIRVDEFGLGFPPSLFGKKIGETLYTFNLIPFGGFVKIHGENPDEESVNGVDKDRSFINKPNYIKIAVLGAGIFFNIIFAWLLISASFMLGAVVPVDDYAKYENRIQNGGIIITNVYPQSPAESSGIKPGDEIVAISSKAKKITTDNISISEIQKLVSESGGESLSVDIKKSKGDISSVSIQASDTLEKGKFVLGIAMANTGTLNLPIHLALWEGFKTTIRLVEMITVYLVQFLGSIFVGTADFSTVTGPVGIVGLVGDASASGFTNLMMFTALISINLAIINLVPFPALDGGRILFVLIEAISRRSIPHKVANTVNAIGFMLLILLMVVVTYKDIIKIISN